MEMLKRNDYYEGIMMDVRDMFIGYGRHLEQHGISGQGNINDYEEYLCKKEQEIELEEFKEFCIDHNKGIPQKDIEHIDLLFFLGEQAEWDTQLLLIEQEEYDIFLNSVNKEYEMKLKMINSDNFLEEFQKIYNIQDFYKDFVSAKYIDDDSLYGRVNLIIKINGIDKGFIIDIA